MQKTIQAVPKDLLIRVLNKLKPDYEIFNYKIPFEMPDIKPSMTASGLVTDEDSN